MQYELFSQSGSSSKTWRELYQRSSKATNGPTHPERLFCSMSSENWSEKVSAVRGAYSQRLNAVRRTKEKEFSSWVTPNARDHKDSVERLAKNRADGKVRNDQLPRQITELNCWPTPVAGEAEKAGNYAKGQMGQSLSAKAKRGEIGPPDPASSNTTGKSQELWATPVASNPNEGETLESWEARKAKNKAKHGNGNGMGTPLAVQVNQQNWATPETMTGPHGERGISSNPKHQSYNSLAGQARRAEQNWPTPRNMTGGTCKNGAKHCDLNSKAGGKLNPNWVEQLMGLPRVGWTQLPTEWIG